MNFRLGALVDMSREVYLLLGVVEALGDVRPVDDLPDVLDVVGANILVL